MLGWFKKAFGKKPVEPVASEPEIVDQEAADTSVLIQETAQPDDSASQLLPEVKETPPQAAETEEQAAPVELTAAAGEPAPAAEPAVVTPSSPEAEVPIAVPEEADEVVEAVEAEKPVEEPEAIIAESMADAAGAAIDQEAATVDDEELPVLTAASGQQPPETAEVAAESAAEDEVSLPEAALVQEETVQDEGMAGAEAPEPAEDYLSSHTQEKPGGKSMFRRLQERLGKTRDALVYRLDRLFLGKKEIDQDLFEQLEEILITSDLGVATTLELLDRARKKVKRDQLNDPQVLKDILRDQILAYIEATDQPAELVMPAEGPFVIMVVGVNGVGKTTTIGKIAAKFVRAGQSVLLIAADTFRAAAINQLKIWGERVGVPVIAQNPGADPSSVVYDGLEHGLAHHHDVIIIDTAGRLHTSVNLMEELKKIKRVIGKKLEGAPHEVMLVLDATTGQNGIAQAKMFHEAVGVSGLTLTKLDGTAKGGIVANICREIKIPVRFIGIGEQLDDLRDFEAREFVDALFARSTE